MAKAVEVKGQEKARSKTIKVEVTEPLSMERLRRDIEVARKNGTKPDHVQALRRRLAAFNVRLGMHDVILDIIDNWKPVVSDDDVPPGLTHAEVVAIMVEASKNFMERLEPLDLAYEPRSLIAEIGKLNPTQG